MRFVMDRYFEDEPMDRVNVAYRVITGDQARREEAKAAIKARAK